MTGTFAWNQRGKTGIRYSYVLHAGFDDKPLAARRRAAHHPALVIEVAEGKKARSFRHDSIKCLRKESSIHAPEHNKNTSSFFAERVFDRRLDILERDESRACARRVRRLDMFRFNALLSFDQYDSEAVLYVPDESQKV